MNTTLKSLVNDLNKRVVDGRSLNAICKKFGLTYDKKHKYILSDDLKYLNSVALFIAMDKEGFKLQYFDGCFYPFIVKREAWENENNHKNI